MDEVDLGVAGLRSVAPIVFGIGGVNIELGKPDLVLVGHVLHVEEGLEPFLA